MSKFLNMGYDDMRIRLLEISEKLKNQDGTLEELENLYYEQVELVIEMDNSYKKLDWMLEEKDK